MPEEYLNMILVIIEALHSTIVKPATKQLILQIPLEKVSPYSKGP